MADPIPTLTAPNFRKSIEVVPGNKFLDSQLEGLVRGLNNEGAGATTIINNFITIIQNIVNGGLGGVDNGCRIIGWTTPARAQVEPVTCGNDTLRLTHDGILVFCWREAKLSVPNTYEYYAKKALPPYDNWTSLDGTSQDASLILSVDTGAGNPNAPVFCEWESSGELHFIHYVLDTGVNYVRDHIMPRTTDGRGWSSSGTSTVNVCKDAADTTVQRSNIQPYLGDIISTPDALFFLGYANGACCGEVFRYPCDVTVGTATYRNVWGSIARYSSQSNVGDERRIVDLGNGNLIVLMETQDVFSGNDLIAWAVLPASSSAQSFSVGTRPNVTVSSYVLPSLTSNLIESGAGGQVFASWSAARITGTNRVGLVYTGVDAAASGSQPAGVFYTEFDASIGTWLAQSLNVVLLSGDVDFFGGVSRKLSSVSGASGYSNVSGKAFFGGDGTPRALWFHGIGIATAGSFMSGLCYRRLKNGGASSSSADWNSTREIHSFGGRQSDDNYRSVEFQGCRNVVTINGLTYLPVVWSRRPGRIAGFVAQVEFCFKLLPTAMLDGIG